MPAVRDFLFYHSSSTKLIPNSGENPNRVYSQTRMDAQWNFRNAYNEATKIKANQDAFCEKVEDDEGWTSICEQDKVPESLELESLVDVLRGKVKVRYAVFGL